MEKAFNVVKNVYGYNPKVIYLDGEKSLQINFDALLGKLGILQRRTALDTSEQSKAEKAGHILSVKCRSLMAQANIPFEMWNEGYLMAVYIENRTPVKAIGWKTPFEAFTNRRPMAAHMHPFGCRAFAKIHKIPRLQKMSPRALVGYLMGYDSTNIFRIWIPSQSKVIRTRDVRFDDDTLYNPRDIELGALQTHEVQLLYEELEIPDVIYDRLREFDADTDDDDMIIDSTSRTGISAQFITQNTPNLEHNQPLQNASTTQNSTIGAFAANDANFSTNSGVLPAKEANFNWIGASTREKGVIGDSPNHEFDPLHVNNSINSTSNYQLPTPRDTESPSPPQNLIFTPSESGENEPLRQFDDVDSTASAQINTPGDSIVSSNPTESSADAGPSRASFRAPEDRSTTRSRANRAPRARDITADMSEDLVLPHRTRRGAYAALLHHVSTNEPEFHAAFAAAAQTQRLHISEMPPEPKTWKELLVHPYMKQFMIGCGREITDLESKGAFRTIPMDSSIDKHLLLPLMWVFKYKTDSNGFVTKFKARLVARGDLQKNENDTYAATAAVQTFRTLMAIAAAFNLDVKQFDIKNAYINALLTMPILCGVPPMPPGFEKKNSVLQLLRALYGLKSSGHLWYQDFVEKLQRLGLYRVPSVNCLFTNDWLLVLFYVDDIVALYHPKHASKYKQFERELISIYEVHVLGDIENFLGIRVLRNRPERKLALVLDAYIERIADRFGIPLDVKPPHTPLPPYIDLSPNTGQATMLQLRDYQQRVGSVLYANVQARPDIARACSKLSEYNKSPSSEHIKAAKHLLRYTVGTRYLAIEFDGSDSSFGKAFHVTSDASYGDNDDRTSSYGYCFQLLGGCIDYKASKQKTVTKSTTEAELLSVSVTATLLIWYLRFFKHIGLSLDEDTVIYCDNQQTIRLLTIDEPKLQTKLKHVDIHSHWLRQEVQAGRVKLEYLPSAQIVADGFTKELPRQKHEEFVRQLRLVDVRSQLATASSTDSNKSLSPSQKTDAY